MISAPHMGQKTLSSHPWLAPPDESTVQRFGASTQALHPSLGLGVRRRLWTVSATATAASPIFACCAVAMILSRSSNDSALVFPTVYSGCRTFLLTQSAVADAP
ncbi:hypothetical protein L1887_60778 [Cichorium endivia]|nr:hypothetical protein L1887_60778 [Cichorium endivia]